MNSAKFRIITPMMTSIQSPTPAPVDTRLFIQWFCSDEKMGPQEPGLALFLFRSNMHST